MNKFKSAVSQMAIVAGLALSINATASADQVFADDVIVQGSICVGLDCVNGESFGFDTLRLKENNLRIHFQDTSTSASFPTNDWRIVINDSSNGGGNYFAIEDSNASRQPFRVDAGARANSLYVDSQGDVGLGTSTPVVNMHVVDGNTPTLRLEQDGSSGFTPQTFDVAANEANFFIRDATNGSRLSFRIRPGAPESSIDIAANGRVGLGTTSPQAALDVHVSASSLGSGSNTADKAGIRIMTPAATNAVLAFDAEGDGEGWRVVNAASDDSFRVSRPGSGVTELLLDASGNLLLSGSVTTASGNTCAGGCDAVFGPDYDLPTIQEHGDFMLGNRYLMHVGPTSESGPFNLSEKVGGMLSELEYAHLYIYQLHSEQAELEATVVSLSQRLEILETR